MATDFTTAFWSFVINNYDETDLALVQQGYPDYVRQIVYTLEEGESGTPHIQAYVRLYRQQRMSYIKRLYPGASGCRALLAQEYKLNAQRYAQKLDETARSPAIISNNPFPDPVKELLEVIRDSFETYHESRDPSKWRSTSVKEMEHWSHMIENARVVERPMLAKFYISPTYVKVWRNFAMSLMQHVCNLAQAENAGKLTHTHTYTYKGEKFSPEEGITQDAAGVSFQEPRDEDEDLHEEEGEDDEGDLYSSGSESEASAEGDDSGSSECSFESED